MASLTRPPAPAGPSLAESLRSLVTDVGHLFRTELRLARSEVVSSLHSAMRGAIAVGIGMILMLGAIFTMLGAIVGWLTPLLGAGWAAAAVALGAAVVAIALMALGARQLSPSRAAERVSDRLDTLRGE